MKQRLLSVFLMIVILILHLASITVAVENANEPLDGNSVAIKTFEFDKTEEKFFTEETSDLTDNFLQYINENDFKIDDFAFRVPEQETLNTYVFQRKDGMRTVYILDENVKFIDVDGKIIEKDITLNTTKDGFGITKSNINLAIPNDLNKGISLSYDNYNIKLYPRNITSNTFAKKSDNSIVYQDAYGSGVNLRYTPTLSGIKEDIILDAYLPNLSFTFSLKTDGLFLFKNAKGYYLAKDEKSDPIFYLGEIIMYDAVGKPGTGTVLIDSILEGDEYSITIYIDDNYLSDSSTMYPVTIDPSITISDTENNDNAIEDSPIYSGYPNTNFATYYYNPAGTPNSNNGIGRTVVRLNGLINSSIYKNLTVSQITSVTFNVKESSGTSSQFVNLYPLTGNTTWKESTVTWNNIGSYSTSVNYGSSLNNGQWTAFDITNLVKSWKNGTYSASAGFILKNQTESNLKNFCSSEYPTASYRPYVILKYDPKISLNYNNTNVNEGSTKTLTATTSPSGQTVTWSSSNSAVATVSSSGVVTGKKAGSTTIQASFTSSGTTYYAECTVYVTIPNGVYYISNLNSNLYLHVKDGGISNKTDVCQFSKYSTSSSDKYRIRQMWKTYYLGDGRYSIRPISKSDMGLDVTSGNVDIYSVGTSDTLSGIQSYGEWSIEWYSTGYILKNNNENAKTMQVINSSTTIGSTVIASSYSISTNCRWKLEKISTVPSGIYLYNTSSKSVISNITKYTAPEEVRTLSNLSLVAVAYDGTNINQTFSWTTSNSSLAAVDSSGAVTGKSPGTVTITATKYLSGNYYSVSFKLIVTEIANGTYFLENKRTEKYVDIEYKSMNNGTKIHQWEFHSGRSQQWTFTHLGDGYYSIKSANSSSNFYLGVSEDSTGNDAPVVLRTGSVTDGMKWKFSKTSSGAYKITPKTGEANDRVLAVGFYLTSTDGIAIQQRDYVNDSNYKDEWNLYLFRENRYKLLAYNDGKVDRNEYFNSVKNTISKKLGDDIYTQFYNSITKIQAKMLLCDSDIFIIHTHGQKDGIYISDSSYLSMNDIDNLDLSNLRFALLLACSTAQDYLESNITNNTPTNIVEKMVCQGAETVVGFEFPTYVNECNDFVKQFAEKAIISGMTVETAIEKVDCRDYVLNMSYAAIIAGNKNLKLN